MGGKASRDKGANGEREVIRIFNDELGMDLKRNLDQYQGTDCDCRFDGLAIEIKRQEKLQLRAWWKQICEVRGDDLPVLIYRQSRQPWRVILPLHGVSELFVYWQQGQPLIPEWSYDFERRIEMELAPMFTDVIREVSKNNAMHEMAMPNPVTH